MHDTIARDVTTRDYNSKCINVFNKREITNISHARERYKETK